MPTSPHAPAAAAFPGAPMPERLPSASRLFVVAVALVAVCASAGLVASEVEQPMRPTAAAEAALPGLYAEALGRLASN